MTIFGILPLAMLLLNLQQEQTGINTQADRSGRGYYKEKGQPARELKKGDVVKIPPNVEHWHGAAPDSWFAHISLETNIPNNETTWLDPVTDEQYHKEVK